MDDVPHCPAGLACTDDDITHRLLRRHPLCPQGALCQQWQDEVHSKRLGHPKACRDGAKCEDVRLEHMTLFCHLPECEDGAACALFQGGDARLQHHGHCSQLRHIKPRCPHGTYCALFADAEHTGSLSHPFMTPCPKTPYRCHRLGEKEHRESFAHLCQWGTACRDTSGGHKRQFIHVPRAPCPLGAACGFDAATRARSLEQCLGTHAHPGLPDIRKPCEHGALCHQRSDPEHLHTFWHGLDFAVPVCEVKGINLLRLPEYHYDMAARDAEPPAPTRTPIDFARNHAGILSAIAAHHGYGSAGALRRDISPGVLDWVRAIRPVHAVRNDPERGKVFSQMIAHGGLLSLELLNSLEDPSVLVREVRGNALISKLLGDKEYKQLALNFLAKAVEEACCADEAAAKEAHFEQLKAEHEAAAASAGASAAGPAPSEANVRAAGGIASSELARLKRLREESRDMEAALKTIMQDDRTLGRLKAAVELLAATARKAVGFKNSGQGLGIRGSSGYFMDKCLGTHRSWARPHPPPSCFYLFPTFLTPHATRHPCTRACRQRLLHYGALPQTELFVRPHSRAAAPRGHAPPGLLLSAYSGHHVHWDE